MFSFTVNTFCMKRKYIHLVDDDQYLMLAKIAKGNLEKKSIVKFWLAKGMFEIKDSLLRYNGKYTILLATYILR